MCFGAVVAGGSAFVAGGVCVESWANAPKPASSMATGSILNFNMNSFSFNDWLSMIGYQTNGIRKCKHRMARIVAWQNKPNKAAQQERQQWRTGESALHISELFPGGLARLFPGTRYSGESRGRLRAAWH